jgi:drug/metabolite transporter (DMT)-like permease
VVAIIAFVSAVVYGASDFLGGIAARRMSSLLVAQLAFIVAFVASGIVVLVSGPIWSPEAVWLGVIAGISGSIGQWAFFACLAIGPMSVLSPGVAAIYALLPAIVGIALGERFPPVGYLALAAVVVATVLLALTHEGSGGRISPRALLLGLVAGVGFGGYIIAIDSTPAESGVVPLFVDLAVGILFLGVILLVNRIRNGPAELNGIRDRTGLWQAIACGATLAVANIMLVFALHMGDLALVGVINSLYPLGTVLLALIVLHERLRAVQWVGVGLAIAASAVLAVV